MDFMFKKNFLGQMVLHVKARIPVSSPGDFETVYVKADEVDAAKIMQLQVMQDIAIGNRKAKQ